MNRHSAGPAPKGIANLRDYLVAHGVTNLTNLMLTNAYDISGDGKTIVAFGTSPDGQTEAWVASVPESGSWALAAMAIAGLLAIVIRTKRAAGSAPRYPVITPIGRIRANLRASRNGAPLRPPGGLPDMCPAAHW